MIEKHWIKENQDYLVKARRKIHREPELGFEEHKTGAFLKEQLTGFGYTITQTEPMKTGFCCDYGAGKGPVLGIRCELDAVPMFDAKEVPYHSVNPGVMHSCGHDVHMAVMLGLAKWLQDQAIMVNGTIRFIFQPSEEKAPGGALAMIDGGAIKEMNHIMAMHVLPKLEVGKIGIRHGAMSAMVDIVNITLSGEGGHTSSPHRTVDLISSAAYLINTLDQILKYRLDPQNPVVLGFGAINGGSTFNVIPSKVNLQGTLRYLNQDMKNHLHSLIGEIIYNVSEITGAKIEWHMPYSAPGIFNDETLTSMIIDAANNTIGTENLTYLEDASMGGEDFAYYLEHIPGAYFRVGSSDGYSTDLHSISFDVNESCIITAIEVISDTIKNYFKIGI